MELWASTSTSFTLIAREVALLTNSLLTKFLLALVAIRLGGPRYISIYIARRVSYVVVAFTSIKNCAT
jgi:hypothetical protein